MDQPPPDPLPKEESPKEGSPPPKAKEASPQEPVWTYRGYQLRASEFTTAMVHLFRAEIQRANVWRTRLDTTTNWAVVTTGAAISFSFARANSPHAVILLNIMLVTFFLVTEARRYRYYELWSYRVRLMETDFFAAMLVPPFHPAPDWAEALSENLLHPHFPISNWEAIGRRLRRNYLWIYVVMGLAWLGHLYMLPLPAPNAQIFINRAAVGDLDGHWVLIGMGVYFLLVVIFGLATIGLQQSAGEVLPRYTGLTESLRQGLSGAPLPKTNVRAWFRPSYRRQQLLTLIITDKAEAVGGKILKETGRGVTRLSGTGMYTGQPHAVLMCALSVTEVNHLRALVNSEDPKAFVIVSPAQEIFGTGFMPLQEE
jgi:uncharacterized membrane protein